MNGIVQAHNGDIRMSDSSSVRINLHDGSGPSVRASDCPPHSTFRAATRLNVLRVSHLLHGYWMKNTKIKVYLS